ncbi:hypothetical protein SAMN04488047_12921 [Tranquillimonas alkanivorans]|uniref:Uncharacterized protein n=2 Tax=Tranquillimonas alkanivorans TaxID=441119 RepID=A0A1I5VD30_9RHOB|nr:hypothetical protein SAMN04488047_12921 [Tranquillimonas alkanivorans]
MCRPSRRAKFCTCAPEEDIGYLRWELWRSAGAETDSLAVVGSIVPPSLDHVLLVERHEEDLNHSDTFDADLHVREGNNLILEFDSERTYAFEFRDGIWRERVWGAPRLEAMADRSGVRGTIRRETGNDRT